MRAEAESFQLVDEPITVHAFNGDRSLVALCPNNHEVHILRRSAGGWELQHILREHDSIVTGIDWGARTDRIVTCSQDRNAYVWDYVPETKTWKPQLVLLRIQRAATCVAFSPKEDKIAVGTGNKVIAICHYEASEDWWISRHLKKVVNSTVLNVRWHPNNVLLAAGCADGRALVLSAYVKGVDEKPAPGPWGERMPFDHVCGDFHSPFGGFVHDVAFSPSGSTLAFTSHDSTVNFVSPPRGVSTVQHDLNPFKSIMFLGEDAALAAGFDNDPYLLRRSQGSWELVGKVETGSYPAATKRSAGSSGAFAKFRQLDSQAQSSSRPKSAGHTMHQNAITCIRLHTPLDPCSTPEKFSLTGLDGKLSILDFTNLPDIASLQVA